MYKFYKYAFCKWFFSHQVNEIVNLQGAIDCKNQLSINYQ